jgi:hypothetical protein
MIAEGGGDRIELVKTRLREWSGAAQPDRFVDAISLRFRGGSPARSTGSMPAADVMTRAGAEDWRSSRPRIRIRPVFGRERPLFVGFDVQKPPSTIGSCDGPSTSRSIAATQPICWRLATQRPACQILRRTSRGYVHAPYTSTSGVVGPDRIGAG